MPVFHWGITMHDNNEKLKLIAQGNELSHRGFFYKARSCFAAARKIDPTCNEVKIAELNNTALRYRRLGRKGGRFSDAIKIYHNVLKIRPEDIHALLSIGILTRESNPTEALKYLDRALALDPNNDKIWEVKWWCYRGLGDIASELACYYKVQKIKPSIMIQRWIEGVNNRYQKWSVAMQDKNKQETIEKIKALDKAGKYPEVIAFCEAALALFQDCPEVWCLKARSHYALKDYLQAIECFEKFEIPSFFKMTQTKYADAKKQLSEQGLAAFDSNDYETAKKCFRKALTLAPAFPLIIKDRLSRILTSEGLRHVLTKNYDAALQCYEEILSLEPESVLAQNNMIEILLERSHQSLWSKHFDRARQDIERVLKINPDHVSAKESEKHINRMEEITVRKKNPLSRVSSSSDFWDPKKRSRGSDTDLDLTPKDDNARPIQRRTHEHTK